MPKGYSVCTNQYTTIKIKSKFKTETIPFSLGPVQTVSSSILSETFKQIEVQRTVYIK